MTTHMTLASLAPPPGLARLLVSSQLSSGFFKYSGLVAVAAGIAGFTWFSSTDPKGIARRASIAYVARLDGQLRSMFKPARGEQIAWLQGCGSVALLALYGFIPFSPLIYLAMLALILPPILITVAVGRRRKQIDDQTHGFALALSNALKTTASIGDALWVTVSVSASPLKEEVETALKQVRIGSTLEEALLAMSARAGAPALDVVVSALLIGRQMGGDLPRILDGTAASLRELKRLEELTARVVASAKQSLTVSAALVAGLAFALPRLMIGFFDPLRDTVKGQVIAAQCAVVYLLAIYLGYRFTRTDI